MKFTEEQLKKAKGAKSAEELLAFAKESGVEMTEEEAKQYFSELHKEGELADDELSNVAGGCGRTLRGSDWFDFTCPFCSQQLRITMSYYDDYTTEQSHQNCGGCGAEITVFASTCNANYKKGSQETTVYCTKTSAFE